MDKGRYRTFNAVAESSGIVNLQKRAAFNQLNYVPGLITGLPNWWAVQDSNLRPPACKAGALTS